MNNLRERNIDGLTGRRREMKNTLDLILKYTIEKYPVLLLGKVRNGKNHKGRLLLS